MVFEVLTYYNLTLDILILTMLPLDLQFSCNNPYYKTNVKYRGMQSIRFKV